MRLYLKLFLLIGVAVGAQVLVSRNFEELDEAQFTLRVMCAQYLPGDSEEQLSAAAERLCERRLDRFIKELDERQRREVRTCAAAGRAM